jgi:BASS family bile acid:Na+ symporter
VCVAFVIVVGVAVGCATYLKDLIEIFSTREKRTCMLCGMLCQFGCMPLLAFLLTVIFPIGDGATYSQSAVVLSIQLVGCMPGGTTSNLFTWFVGGNVPLSIVMSWCSTVCAIFMTPLLLLVYYKSRYPGGEGVDIPVFNIVISLFIMIWGVAAGMAVLRYGGQRAAGITGQVMAVLSLVFLVGTAAVGIDPDGLASASWTAWVVAVLLQPLGYACGLGIAYLFHAGWKDMKTISIETGIQNFGLAFIIISLSIDRDPPEYYDCVLVVALCNLLYVPHSLWIVLLMRYAFPPDAQKEQADPADPQKEQAVAEAEMAAEQGKAVANGKPGGDC